MIAHWVALNLVNEARAGLLKLPTASQDSKQETTMLGEHWLWQGYASNTSSPSIREIHVEVYHQGNKTRLANLTSYLYVAK